jgi:hypothetical protein
MEAIKNITARQYGLAYRKAPEQTLTDRKSEADSQSFFFPVSNSANRQKNTTEIAPAIALGSRKTNELEPNSF